jgi:hypothetical protein
VVAIIVYRPVGKDTLPWPGEVVKIPPLAEVLEVLKRQLKDDRNAFLLSPKGETPLWGGRHDAQRILAW